MKATRLRILAVVVTTMAATLAMRPEGGAAATRNCAPRSHANLSGCAYAGRSLRHVSFKGSNLTNASFVNDDVTGASFAGARMAGVVSRYLRGRAASLPAHWVLTLGMLIGPSANLAGAQLTSGSLYGVDLQGANLRGVSMSDADLDAANFNGADLTGATVSGAHAQGASFVGARMTSSLWKSSVLVRANLRGANLARANMTDAVLISAHVQGAQLQGATLAGATTGSLVGTPSTLPSGWRSARGYLIGPGAALGAASLVGANLAGANLTGATLTNASLQKANLSGGSLDSAKLGSAKFAGANLSQQSLNGAEIQQTEMGDSTLSGTSGDSLTGAPASLPAGWAVSNGSLQTVPSEITAIDNFNMGQWIESSNGDYTVNMQTDGNLVEYHGGTAIWATGTNGQQVQTVLQSDCNLVIYSASAVGQPSGALYTTGTGGGPANCTFSVADDGTLAITTPDGTVRWARYPDGTLYSHRITMKQNAPVYNGTNDSTGQTGTIPTGQAPNFVCWTQGQKIGGVDVWFYVLWNGSAGYYPSYYDNSVYSADYRISIDYGIPRCGSVPTTFTPPSNGSVPVSGPATITAPIHLTTDAYMRPGPSTGSGDALATMPSGTSPGYLCWTRGEQIRNVDVWFKVYWNGTTGYYASGLDDSHYVYDAQITAKYGIPACAGTTVVTPAPSAPPATSTGAYVQSSDGSPIHLHSCITSTGWGCILDDTLVSGTSVSMLCWASGVSESDGGQSSGKWFLVFHYVGSDSAVYAWVSAVVVKNQAVVPSCDSIEDSQFGGSIPVG